MPHQSGFSGFYRFLLGFVAMLSVGFGTLIAAGFYQAEWTGKSETASARVEERVR